jgi:hypothetical protein
MLDSFAIKWPSDYEGDVLRLVETQEQSATLSLVDDFEEQSLLEDLLENTKPPLINDVFDRHYLISSPFRYPPLKHGSRFGDITMPSYFYASENIRTCLTESAFYRLGFVNAMKAPFERSIISEHMSFSVRVSTSQAIDFTKEKNLILQEQLMSPVNYQFTQKLGKFLTEKQHLKLIRYNSARVKDGVNVAIAKPDIISSNKPFNCQQWLCITKNESVMFRMRQGGRSFNFFKQDYIVQGEFPEFA